MMFCTAIYLFFCFYLNASARQQTKTRFLLYVSFIWRMTTEGIKDIRGDRGRPLRNNDVDIEKFIGELRVKDKTINRYQFNKCLDRNIILIGRTRTGKSTIAEVIHDITHISPVQELYSQTRTIQFKTISTDTKDSIWYYFNFIDLPGFFDIAVNGRQSLSNEKVSSYFQECITKNITNIHMFAFVFNLSAGINERDIETMLYMKKTYPRLSQYMALVITHCEQMTSEQRQRLIAEFWLHPQVAQSKLKDYFRVGTLFMGCLRNESVSTANAQSMYFEYNNILDMRTEFIEKCIHCAEPYNIYKEGNENKCNVS